MCVHVHYQLKFYCLKALEVLRKLQTIKILHPNYSPITIQATRTLPNFQNLGNFEYLKLRPHFKNFKVHGIVTLYQINQSGPILIVATQ
jgi:hypothetical protein